MEQPFPDVIEVLSALSAAANDHDAAMMALVNGQNLLMDLPTLGKVDKLGQGPGPQLDLKRFLKALKEEELFALVALMYCGRDRIADPVEYWKQLRATVDGKEDAVRTILEKTPRMEYIRVAISNRPKSLNLEDLPSLLAQA
jgi:Protein of unknown function (DUF3775)